MQKAIQVGKLILLASVAFLCISLGVLVCKSIPASQGILTKIQNAVVIYTKLGNDSRVTVDNLNKAAIDERFYFENTLPAFSIKANTMLDSANSLIVSATRTSDTLAANTTSITNHTDAAIDTLNTQISSIAPAVQSAQKTITDVDMLVPSVQQNLDQSNKLLAQADDTVSHATSTMANVDKEVDRFVNPPPKKWYQKVWDITKTAAQVTFEVLTLGP